MRGTTQRDKGSVLLVVIVFLTTAIAGLAAITSSRGVAAAKTQRIAENESRAINSAYAQIHMAMNVVNGSAYDAENHNLEIRNAIAGMHGGTLGGGGGATAAGAGAETGYTNEVSWLDVDGDPLYGLIKATNVRVYRAREYIERLDRLKGEAITQVDPTGLSDSYFVLESAGREGNTIRLVSALVRENEPFSSFVFFQNRATLGVSGAPRGLIHANESLAFYFANGNYVDSVSSVQGFDYVAGATAANTNLRNANPDAARIDLEAVDFADLMSKADFFTGQSGLDAEVKMFADGRVRIKEYTPPRYDMVERTFSETVLTGYTQVTTTETQQVQVGTTTEQRTRQVVVGYNDETYTVTLPVYENQPVEYTRQVPIYETQTVTRTRWVRVFVPYDTGAEGGTSVGGDGGVAGEYQWVLEEYQTQEQVIVGYNTETYTVIEQVQVGTRDEQRTRSVPIYDIENYTVEVPVYEPQEVEVTRNVPVYTTNTYTQMVEEFFPPVLVNTTYKNLDGESGTIYIDGRVTRLYGDLNGRLTVVGNEKVRVTGNVRYVDSDGNTAMRNGNNYTQPYQRNPNYNGNSVLGVIARDDILMTRNMPRISEINGTLMSVNGRVGIDGFWADSTGELHKDRGSARNAYLTDAQRATERAYDGTAYRTRTFRKDSLRRIGGIVSNNRVMETYIRPRSDGTSYVDRGFKRGSMKFDISLLFNPPPNFVEIPRPVLTYFVPIMMVRNSDA